MIIVEVGSLNMDLVVRMPKIPKPGETLLGGVFKSFLGGKGASGVDMGRNIFHSVTNMFWYKSLGKGINQL